MPVSDIAEGTIPFTIDGETYSTWYKIFGRLPSARPPLVVLHGGPGISHDYMLPLADLCSLDAETTVIFYDQLGSGQSTNLRLTKKDTSFWTIAIFVSELENVLAHFGISQSYDLLGHSWGATLAAEFIARRQPSGLRRLILADGLASSKLRNESVERLRATLPNDVQETFRRHEEDKTTDSPEYKAAMQVFHANFGCRLKPVPSEVIFSLSQLEREGGRVLEGIQNHGMANDWSIVDRLHFIRVPTLLINGRYDFMADEVCKPFFLGIEKVKWIRFASSSHTPHWEERELYMSIVNSFLHD